MTPGTSSSEAVACDNSFAIRLAESSRNSYFNLTLSHAECSALAHHANLQDMFKPTDEAIEDLMSKGLIWINDIGRWELTTIGQHAFNLICMANVNYYRAEFIPKTNSPFARKVRNVGFTATLSKAQVRALYEIVNTDGSTADVETLEALIAKGFIIRMKDPGKPMVQLTAPGSVMFSILNYAEMRGD